MDLVIPAFAEVRKRFPDVRLLVVGDGSLRGSMEQQAQELGCADAVIWAGRQPQESLPQYYGEMDMVLMPSRSEGFGLTAIEAMACGCVVVASDVGGLPEVVCDGVCGLLHRTEDVHDMASKINSLIASPELYRTMQKNALQHVQKFSFQRYASAVCDLYERLIAT
jgi:glycosyltransferase involved in cell wall biosynthesis